MNEEALDRWIDWWSKNEHRFDTPHINSPILKARAAAKAAWANAWEQGYSKAVEDLKGLA
jgi:hypothetical protein